MDYPSELHDRHNDYPLAPETLTISVEQMSPHQHKLIRKLKSSGVQVPKLVPNLQPKRNYVVHYRTLQLYVELGLKVTAFHRALKFTQSAWMRPYIELNTDLRKRSSSDFEKDFYKLMNNAVRLLSFILSV